MTSIPVTATRESPPYHAPIIRWCAAAGLVVAGLASPAAAQMTVEAPLQVSIQFDFLSPSARSLALGSAFVGLADDATAALVNPAGLVALTRPEISVEARLRRFEQPFLVGGRLSGRITGIGQDTVQGPLYDTIDDAGAGPTFTSFVYPRGRLRLALFRHELIGVEQDFASRGAFYARGFDVRETAYSAFRTLTVDTYGGSVAFDVRRIWVGAGVLAHRFSLGFEFNQFAHETFYGVPDSRQSIFRFSQDGDDIAIGMVAGVLVPISAAKIDLAYKRAPRFGFSSLSSFPGERGSLQGTSAEFKVPDVLSVGFSTAFATNFLITAEYSRVFHSQLFTDYVDLLVNQGESRTRADRCTIDDAGEVHVGVEYLLATALRPAIRAGFWFDPDHSVQFAPTPVNDLLDGLLNERFGASLSSGRDLWHYTLGTMVSVHPRLDISVGVDHSSRSTLVSTSANVRF